MKTMTLQLANPLYRWIRGIDSVAAALEGGRG